MQVVMKLFKELTTKELYDALQLRSAVFVVEQDCVYQDIDGKDQIALHVLGYKENQLVAYTRAFEPGNYFENASFGRVVVLKDNRGKDFGKMIVAKTVEILDKKFNQPVIEISAQTYLKGFYETFNFKKVGQEYLEDGIPHIKMVRKPKF